MTGLIHKNFAEELCEVSITVRFLLFFAVAFHSREIIFLQTIFPSVGAIILRQQTCYKKTVKQAYMLPVGADFVSAFYFFAVSFYLLIYACQTFSARSGRNAP